MPNEPNQPRELEVVLLRLFRCMTVPERGEIIHSALAMLGKRCSFRPGCWSLSAEDRAQELKNPDLDERMMPAWPGGWPGQGLVDLDSVGDPGYWLAEKLEGEPISQTLFGWNWNDEATAAMLADDYLRTIRELGYPLPSDYDNEAESAGDGWTKEDEKLVRAEFVAFLKHWRERILATLEAQNPPARDGGQ
jgi:hypothetical protein